MHKRYLILIMILSGIISSCEKKPEDLNLDPETKTLVNILQEELQSLDADPLSWKDQDLRWLDPLAEKSVIGLGEATHGTAEFFEAKHRILKYMVENHGYKVFAIEADFGESLFIDEVIQQGNASEIESGMKSKMHFWTWKTEEVKEMLEWMCTYNQGKADEDKIHYMGIDCQFNTYHPSIAREYLSSTGIPFYAFADSILRVAETEQNFESFNSASFESYIGKLEALKDSMILHKDELVAASSEKEYQLNSRIVELVRQVSEVRYYNQVQDFSINYRDKYMAENTAWILDYFGDKKIVLWAHNGHISNYEYGVTGTLGNYLAWFNAFEMGLEYFQMGAVYNNRPSDYYTNFDPDLFHYIIYFNKSTASELL